MRRRTTIAAAGTALLAGCAGVVPARPDPTPVKVIVFPGGFNWPLWVAQDQGLLAKGDADAQLHFSVEGADPRRLRYRDDRDRQRDRLPGGTGRSGRGRPRSRGVMGSDPGFLRLVTSPNVRSYADLRGKTLSVDALTTGYAFVLLEMLERNGLRLDRDYGTRRHATLPGAAGAQARRHDADLSLRPHGHRRKAIGCWANHPMSWEATRVSWAQCARAGPGPTRRGSPGTSAPWATPWGGRTSRRTRPRPCASS